MSKLVREQQERNANPSQLVLACVHHQGNDVRPIPRTTEIENFNRNIAALALQFIREEIELESIASTDAAKGGRYIRTTATYRKSETPPLSSRKPA
ncbi:Uncharacterized protein TCM_020143 [Theobroma cacao]|uniref:Uncharacterized protein n=1 Tax=Theobroma cacao TaxID=3641 RepID=A0A061EKY0_THECC|nr:Uncharacterized protein TCM_020143 [Theobroma cacao]